MNPSDFSLNDIHPLSSGSSKTKHSGIFPGCGPLFLRAALTAAAVCMFFTAAKDPEAAELSLTDQEPTVTFQLRTDPSAFMNTPVSLSMLTEIPVRGRVDASIHLNTSEALNNSSRTDASETSGSSQTEKQKASSFFQLFEAGLTHTASFGSQSGTDKEVLTEIGMTASHGLLTPYQQLSYRYTRESAPFSLISRTSCRWIYPLCFTFTEQITVLEVINRHIGISAVAAAGLTNTADQTANFTADSAAGSTSAGLSPTEQFTAFSSSFDISSQISIIQEKTRHHIGFSLSFVHMGVLPGIQYSCSIIL